MVTEWSARDRSTWGVVGRACISCRTAAACRVGKRTMRRRQTVSRRCFDAALAGSYDDGFKIPAPQDEVHVSGSIDLLTLGIIFDLYGVTTAELYKGDPERYVRSVLTSLKLLGMPKMYLSWPVYAFTAEALGQPMIYSDRFSPGTDPDDMLVDADNWQDLPPLDLTSGIPRIIDETLSCYRRLTGFKPVLHLSAPYSLAADIFGQEQLITALTYEPDFVNRFLDHLADTVHKPWMDHFFNNHPDGWVELSDASGSPFFIGPQNCKDMAIRSTQRLIAQNQWGERVYDANYRGDYVTLAAQEKRFIVATKEPNKERCQEYESHRALRNQEQRLSRLCDPPRR